MKIKYLNKASRKLYQIEYTKVEKKNKITVIIMIIVKQ